MPKIKKPKPIDDALDLDKLMASLDDNTPDALEGIEETGDLEKDSKAEISAVMKAFNQRGKDEDKRMREATDSEYWFAVCFQTREQKDKFLKELGWFDHGDKYLDGYLVAKSVGVTLPSASVKYRGEKAHKKIVASLETIQATQKEVTENEESRKKPSRRSRSQSR